MEAHAEVDMARHRRYVDGWGGNANVSRYLLDRANAPYELILCLEHLPHTVAAWLLEHPRRLPLVMADMRATITFLRSQGIIHLDTDFFNMLTDGKRVYLTDFGLALDKQFALTRAEQQFYRQHTDFDYGNLLWSLGSHIYWMYRGLSDPDQQRIATAYRISRNRIRGADGSFAQPYRRSGAERPDEAGAQLRCTHYEISPRYQLYARLLYIDAAQSPEGYALCVRDPTETAV